MKEQLKHYRLYEKIMKTELEQPLEETVEFKIFSKIYPHIAESIRLKRKIKLLTNNLKSQDNKGSEFKIKREIAATKSKLQRNDLFKRLHGESKKEALFHIAYKRKLSKIRISVFMKKIRTRLGQPLRKFQRKQGGTLHRNLPPTLFNLREMDMTEKGMVLREWLHEKRKTLRNKIISEV
ncbi:MAG: hypothetical protein CW716_03930 [Candidatus Bathyarchaeum sp.]|nr:MAG: hypothetical protein CW716_03930 [Candidatus Bathyarchaeum sp.]